MITHQQSITRDIDFAVQDGLDAGLTMTEAERQAQELLLLGVQEDYTDDYS